MLLRAYNELELNKKGYSLVMIGSRSVRSPEFEKYLKDLPPEVRNSVRIFDNIPPEEVGIFYRECRMFVYPSLAEGFGLPPLEAYAAGASVICSNTTAMADFKFLGRRLFNPDSLQELKERIMTYIDCPGEKEPGAINQIKHIYNWKRSAEILKEILLADS
jgi:glycosyltransferase involved in cell wall biosynthesis